MDSEDIGLKSRPLIHHNGSSYFHGAHNLTLTNLNITNVQGDHYVTPASGMHLSGFSSLHQQISHNAMFDSAARYPAGRCHPGTREKIIETIMAWINDPSPNEHVLWLHGSVGVGKSAIMQTIAEILSRDHKERYAGSFFFANGIVGREEGSALFPTLSYQIAVNLPGMRFLIDAAMDHDLTLPTKSMPVQLKSLLIDPFTDSRTTSNYSQHMPTVLIDGLDECQGSSMQCQILSSIANAISVSQIPLRFLIASRPEYWLKDAFAREPLRTETRKLSLNAFEHDNFLSVRSDIERFLVDGFDSIFANNSGVMADVERPWPLPNIIRALVQEASGQFIYASTILKFVGGPAGFCDPAKQLNIITELNGTSRATAFSALDTLYLRILSAFPRPDSLKSVLAGLLLHLPTNAIETLLKVEKNEVLIVLSFLSSLLEPYDSGYLVEDKDVDDDEDLVTIFGSRKIIKANSFSYLSFQEFLLDDRRSGPFSISLKTYREQICTQFFEGMIQNLRGMPGPEEHRGFIYHAFESVIKHETILPTVLNRLSHLHQQLVIFSNSQTLFLSRPATLIRSLRSIEIYIIYLQRRVHPPVSGQVLAILQKKVYPKIVQHMLSSGYLKITDNLIYTMADYIGLQTLSDLPGNDVGRAKIFLLQNAEIITFSESRIVSFGPGPSSFTRSYNILYPIQNVFESGSLAELGTFHHEYRLLNMEVCHRCFVYLMGDPIQEETWDIVVDILFRFFKNSRLSDIDDDHDLMNPWFLSAITTLLEFSWTECERIVDRKWQALTMSLIDWSGRQALHPRAMEIISRHDRNLTRKLQTFPKRLFEEILPSYLTALHPYLSEVLEYSPSHQRWRLQDTHLSLHRHHPDTVEIYLDLDRHLSDDRQIFKTLENLSGDSAPEFVISLSQSFLKLHSDFQSSQAGVSTPSLGTASSSSLYIRAIEKILATLRVIRYMAVDS